MVWKAIEAGHMLAEKGIDAEVVNIHTIKPLDRDAIVASAKKTGCVVTAEEHQMNGGLGDSIAQLLSRELPTPMEFVAVNDSFGESGTPDQLLEKYGIDFGCNCCCCGTCDVEKGINLTQNRRVAVLENRPCSCIFGGPAQRGLLVLSMVVSLACILMRSRDDIVKAGL